MIICFICHFLSVVAIYISRLSVYVIWYKILWKAFWITQRSNPLSSSLLFLYLNFSIHHCFRKFFLEIDYSDFYKAILVIILLLEVYLMRKNRKMSFRELVNENRRQLLKDESYLEKLEKKLDEKHTRNG
jgi:Fur-regulated basic protein B